MLGEPQHAVKCSFILGKRLLTDLYVNGSKTEGRGTWEKKPQRHLEEVHVDPEDTAEEQEKRIIKFKEDGDRLFTDQRIGCRN